ncbi:OLC1v1002706C1 [Oldenlandia corymbosa var. corymbosa]|uniref:OLC1v1002706C1 n=1 Tax=Oldenlandia corymbosa var. corymbosa TaxID=529605 RepID=A0AAV1DAR6_OLDCO|nr:OLC1v1002706C1 [Oldenlandia corymbosa var. corymbosa]
MASAIETRPISSSSNLSSVKILAESPGLISIPSKYAHQSTNTHFTTASVQEDFPQASIPIIDFSFLSSTDSEQRLKAIQELGKACQDWGFFMVVNHGIPERLIKAVIEVVDEFFNLPEEEKMEYETKHVLDPIRYGTSFNASKEQTFFWRDYLKVLVHPHFHSPNNPKHFSELMMEYCQRTRDLASKLVGGISQSLGLEEDYIHKNLELESSQQIFIANYYPPCPQPELAMGMPPHSDHGLLTVLLQNGVGGLQIRHGGKWVNVNALPNSFLVNTGDHLEIFSNGRYKSVLHRAVVNNKAKRISIAVANGPAMDTNVGPCPRLLVRQKNEEGDHQEGTEIEAKYNAMKYREYVELQQGNQLDVWSSLIFKNNAVLLQKEADIQIPEMESNNVRSNQLQQDEPELKSSRMKRILLVLNCVMLGLGNCGGPLVQRLYFVKGGKRIWLSCWLQTAGWPVLVFPILASYAYRRNKQNGDPVKLCSIKPRLFLSCAVIGVLTGVDDYLAAYGVSRLPVTTSALVIATQLAFTAAFAFLLVRQKFTHFTINAIFLLSVGAVVLAFHSSNDRPAHESNLQYYIGFFMTLGASALYGFVLPLMELTCRKAKQVMTYSLVMEMQLVISLFATGFCTIGMLINHDFQALSREASAYELGEGSYYTTLIFSAILWQLFFLGAIGVTFLSSALLSGIVIATLLPVTESLAVVFFHERFRSEKGISLTLSLWGFLSYFYGEIQGLKKTKSKTKRGNPDSIASV